MNNFSKSDKMSKSCWFQLFKCFIYLFCFMSVIKIISISDFWLIKGRYLKMSQRSWAFFMIWTIDQTKRLLMPSIFPLCSRGGRCSGALRPGRSRDALHPHSTFSAWVLSLRPGLHLPLLLAATASTTLHVREEGAPPTTRYRGWDGGLASAGGGDTNTCQ